MSKKPVPSKKQAVSSSKSRHSAYVAKQRKRLLDDLALDKCPTTGETKRRHFMSPSGWFKGRKVIQGKDSSSGITEIQA